MRNGALARRPRFRYGDEPAVLFARIEPMAEPLARLYLITPLLDDVEAFAPRLADACAAGRVDAVLARLGDTDERGLINKIKALAPTAQEHGTALLISTEGVST